MIVFALFFALLFYFTAKYLESYVPLSKEYSYQTGYRLLDGRLSKEEVRENSFAVNVDPKEHARKELERASQRIAVYLYQVSRRSVNGLNYEPSFQELWSFLGSQERGDLNLNGATSQVLTLQSLRDGSYGRYLLRRNALFSEISQYQYEYDLRELRKSSYGYQDFIKIK